MVALGSNHRVAPTFDISCDMPVVLRKSVLYSFKSEGVEWRVYPERVVTVDDTEFVVLIPTDQKFLAFLCAGMDMKVPKNASAVGLAGWQAMVVARNEAQSVSMQPASSLFKSAKRPKLRRRRSEQTKLRGEDAQYIDVNLPPVGDVPQLTVTMIRPVTQKDRVAVKLDQETVSNVIEYVRAHGDVKADVLDEQKRRYRRGDGEDSDEAQSDAVG